MGENDQRPDWWKALLPEAQQLFRLVRRKGARHEHHARGLRVQQMSRNGRHTVCMTTSGAASMDLPVENGGLFWPKNNERAEGHFRNNHD
jgi:hypothetical protein